MTTMITPTTPTTLGMHLIPAIKAATAERLALPVAALLSELESVLHRLTSEQYTRRADDVFFKGTVGGHVRHCLDHARALLDGFETGFIDYDRRDRGTAIESDPRAAGVEICRLRLLAVSAAQHPAAAPLRVAVMPTRDGAGVELLSSLGRELAFVLSHTIHHNASIKGMAVAMGVPLPGDFGYAPSTLAHLDQAEGLSGGSGGACRCAH